MVMLDEAGLPALTPASVSGSVASTLISQVTLETSVPVVGILMISTAWMSDASVAASLVVARFKTALDWVQLPVSSSMMRRSKSAVEGDVP